MENVLTLLGLFFSTLSFDQLCPLVTMNHGPLTTKLFLVNVSNRNEVSLSRVVAGK